MAPTGFRTIQCQSYVTQQIDPARLERLIIHFAYYIIVCIVRRAVSVNNNNNNNNRALIPSFSPINVKLTEMWVQRQTEKHCLKKSFNENCHFIHLRKAYHLYGMRYGIEPLPDTVGVELMSKRSREMIIVEVYLHASLSHLSQFAVTEDRVTNKSTCSLWT